jgi:hypothetical protein
MERITKRGTPRPCTQEYQRRGFFLIGGTRELFALGQSTTTIIDNN